MKINEGDTTMPFGIPDYHKTLSVLHVGTEAPHAYFIPYPTEAAAIRDLRDESSYFKTLIGAWDFKFYKSVTEIENVHAAANEKIHVPMNWQNVLGRGYDTPNYTNMNYPYPVDPPHVPEANPCGVYSREFYLTEEQLKKDVLLNFEGVDSCFYLFINGSFAGYSQVSHMTSEFNITELLKPGRNEIRLAVLKWCDGSYLEDQDMFRASGIFREVYLLTGDYPFESLYLLQHFMNNTFRSLDYQKLSAAAMIMSAVMVVIIGALYIVENKFGGDVEE